MRTSFVAIVIAALAITGVAQVSNNDTTQQAGSAEPVASPNPPVIIETTREEFLRSIPGEVHSRPHHRHRNIEEEVEEMNERARERVEEANERARRRLRAIQQGGGWAKVYTEQLNHVIQLMPNAADQLASFETLFVPWTLCIDQPLIFSEESMFTASVSLNGLDTQRVDNFNVVEPLADVVINGCAFGPPTQVGSVQLVLGSPIEGGGQILPLNVIVWGDDTIVANLPDTPGIPDQAGRLVITDTNGNQTSFPVQFYQRRVLAFFAVSSPNDFIAVATTHHTTTDDFRSFNDLGTVGGAPGVVATNVAANHYTFCCSTVHGVDEWFFKLKNGWQIPTADVPVLTGPAAGFVDNIQNFPQLKEIGFTNCGLFSSGDGQVDRVAAAIPPNSPPYNSYQSEVDVYWTAGSNCSGIAYEVGILLAGPEGLPYK